MRRSGNAGLSAVLPLAMVVLLAVLLMPRSPPGTNTSFSNSPTIVQDIAVLPTLNAVSCDDMRQAAPQLNVTIGQVNQVLGTAFAQMGTNKLDCNHLLDYVPVVSSYNQLVFAARLYNPGNATTVNAFYVSAFFFGADMTIIDGKVAYELGFKVTGYLNDLLGLQKISDYCGYGCYAEVLSQIHWFVRINANEILPEFEAWALQNLPNLPTSW